MDNRIDASSLRPSVPQWAASVLLACALPACGSDVGVTQKSLCDGQLQAGEDAVDDIFDRDGDGFFDGANPDCAATYPIEYLDCDDGDPNVNPGVTEVGCNGLDDDCDPSTADEQDLDGDGFKSCEDCNDNDSLIRPNAVEIYCNGLDDDCNPATEDEADADGDGFSACVDCDDTTGQLSPGNTEITCDGIDNDCSEATLDSPDNDGDGVGECEDCDDDDDTRSPEYEEECGDEIDNDCNGEVDEDCQVDYTDVWTLDRTISYSCATGAVNINTSSMTVEDYYPAIRVRMGTSQPGEMNGNFTADTEWFAGNTIAGACTEDYQIVGEFTSDTSLSATLTITFTDSLGWGTCFECTNQTFSFTATR